MPARNVIQIVINADDNASDILKKVTGDIQNIGQAALNIAGAALTGATVAVIGFSTASLAAFSEFETGMNMIFTNLPNITESAMNEMSADVQAFMERTGRSSAEATTAIYDALSAGIPQDNIFAFMEVANKVAIGGVTDLGSAVDGLTSVVNAYGADVISVNEVSDIMFETARLGKTTIEELASFLFQVVPSAAAVGVAFSDVGAALAVITAQGVPTSVAANQIQKAILELSQAGSVASDIFTEVAGMTFPEFIAQGHTMAEAMALMEQAAMEAGVPINQMFTSIEAGQAALSLTGTNMDNFVDATDAMGNSAGATERAFNTMNQGIGIAMNRLGARWESLMISMGRVIEPFITPLVDIFSLLIATFADVLQGGEPLSDWIADLPQWLRPLGFLIAEFAGWLLAAAASFSEMIAAIQAGVDPLLAFQHFLYEVAGAGAAEAFEDLVYWVGEFLRVAQEVLQPVIDWIAANVEIQDVLIALGIAIATVVIPAVLGFFAAFAPLILLIATVALFRTAWEENWGGIQEKTAAVIDWITNTGWPALLGFFQQVADAWTNTVWPGLQQFWDWFMTTGLPAIMEYIETEITPRWELFVGILAFLWEAVSEAFTTFYNWFMTDGLAAIMDFVDTVVDRWNGFVLVLSTIWDLVEPPLTSFYNWFMTDGLAAIMNWIDSEVITRWNTFIAVLTGIWDAVRPALEAFGAGVMAILQPILDAISLIAGVEYSPQGTNIAPLNSGSGASAGVGRQFGGRVSAGVPTWVGETGREIFVPSSDGEIINNRDSELAAQGGGKGIVIHINVYGEISDEQANRSVYKLKRELQAQGLS